MLLVFFDGSLFLKWIEGGGLMKLILPSIHHGPKDSFPDWLLQCVEDCAKRIRTSLVDVRSKICFAFQVCC